jgi:hypothetical protein
MESDGKAPRILNLGTRLKWELRFELRPLYHRRKTQRCVMDGKLAVPAWTPSLPWRIRLTLSRFTVHSGSVTTTTTTITVTKLATYKQPNAVLP